MKQNRKENKKARTNRKAQEEVMGFVIIVLIVMIIGMVFFAFSLRRAGQGPEPKQAELDDLLNSMLSYTTNCEINNKNQSIRELIRQCNNNRLCDNNQNACNVLNTTLETMLQQLRYNIQIANAFVHGYSLNISSSQQLTYIERGNLTGNYFASSIPIPSGGAQDIIVRLKFYYGRS